MFPPATGSVACSPGEVLIPGIDEAEFRSTLPLLLVMIDLRLNRQVPSSIIGYLHDARLCHGRESNADI